MEILSVNQALDALDSLVGSGFCVRGVLSFEHEDLAIYHSPASERRGAFASSIWLWLDLDDLASKEEELQRLHQKAVIVEGKFQKLAPGFGGGHMGLWPAEMVVTRVERA